ncbi:MAG TPA: SH3 domain-containing protein [Syntrophomonadaceae bacterium]|nr:SH3 domain-containing protein [Syntrophomonadaceae bacterium]
MTASLSAGKGKILKPLDMFKSWKTAALLVVFTLLGLGGITLTASAETAIVSGNSVYVRSGPGTSYGSIGSLSKNTSINILERQGGWVKISYGNTTGWVAEYLTSQSPSTVQVSPQVSINGNLITFNANPISVNGYTLVPLKEILENLGATVTWDNNTQTITARKSATTITLAIGSPTATINGQVKNLDVPAQVVNEKTFAPLRFAVEALGGKTIWDEENQVINIYCPSDPRDQLTAVSISADDLNIRNGPSTSEDIVGMAPYGTILAYAAEKDGWYQVKYQGQLGWVASWLVIPLWNTTVSSGKEPTLLPLPSDHQAFVQQMKPYAEAANKGTSLPVDFLLAQWAEESGYGTSSLAQYYNNFGGIKDPDTGGFKKYLSPDEFAQDVIAIYTENSKYNQLLAHARAGASIKTLFNDLTNCHYASSSTYGEKIRTVYLPEIDRALENI